MTAMYLAPRLLSESSGSLCEISNWCIPQSAALHRGKDFAVSFPHFCGPIPDGTLSFRNRRFCSHLSPYGGRELPATLLPVTPQKRTGPVSGLSSPRFLSGRLSDADLKYTIPDLIQQQARGIARGGSSLPAGRQGAARHTHCV